MTEDEEMYEAVTEEEPETVPPVPIIYTGPSMPDLGLRRYTVYSNGLPEYIEAMRAEYEVTAGLFMEVEEFASGNDEIQPGSPEWQEASELLGKIARKEA